MSGILRSLITRSTGSRSRHSASTHDDPLASYEDARAMVARIPASRCVGVRRGGRIFLHKDDQALAEIARFLAESGPDRPRVTRPDARSQETMSP